MTYENEFVQTITGKSLQDCKDKLWKLYKTDYRIVNYKNDVEKGGFLKLVDKPVVKVEYVTNTEYLKKQEESSRKEQEEFSANRQKILDQQSSFLIKNQLQQEIQGLKDELSKQISSIKTASGEKHETIKKIEEILQENDFSFSYIEMITEKIRNSFTLEQMNDFTLVQNYVVDWIGETISIKKAKVYRPPHVFIIVGPTGIGKTSTLIKLLGCTIKDAKQKNLPRPKYCIITIDNIRAGSFEQIKKLVEAIDDETPILQAVSSQDIKEIYDQYHDHVDYIFIDTAGCSPNDSTHIALMKNILDVKMNPDIYLGVTAGTKANDLKSIMRNYEPFAYDSIIVTKNDESNQFGNVISSLWENHKSISYITDGQFVKNIKKPDVVDILLNLTGFELDKQRIENKFGNKD